MAKQIKVQPSLDAAYTIDSATIESATIQDGVLILKVDFPVSACIAHAEYAESLTKQGFCVYAMEQALIKTLLRATVLLP